MFRSVLAATIVLVATVAQSQTFESFYTVQTCAPIMQMIVETTALGETALFEGVGVQYHYTEEQIIGGMIFTVNQETGTWSLLNYYGDGMACLAASGDGFKPASN